MAGIFSNILAGSIFGDEEESPMNGAITKQKARSKLLKEEWKQANLLDNQMASFQNQMASPMGNAVAGGPQGALNPAAPGQQQAPPQHPYNPQFG